jgi:hypothetical protein
MSNEEKFIWSKEIPAEGWRLTQLIDGRSRGDCGSVSSALRVIRRGKVALTHF